MIRGPAVRPISTLATETHGKYNHPVHRKDAKDFCNVNTRGPCTLRGELASLMDKYERVIIPCDSVAVEPGKGSATLR